MTNDPIQNKFSDRSSLVQRILGVLVRVCPFNVLTSRHQPIEQMIRVRSGRHEAHLPLSLIRRIIEEAEPRAFYKDSHAVRMDGGHLYDILRRMDVEAFPKQTQRDIAAARRVSTAACALTFAGDILIDADEETIALANQKGASVQFAGANLIMSIATEAAAKSRRLLSSAG